MNSNALFPHMNVPIYVSYMNETIKFFTSFFGLYPTKIKQRYAKFILEKPSLIISMVENPSRVKDNSGHWGIQVDTTEELESKRNIAKSLGLVTSEETGVNCCYAKQDKFWVTAPDRIQWEVYYFHEDAAFNESHYGVEIATQCCIPVDSALKRKVALSDLGNSCIT